MIETHKSATSLAMIFGFVLHFFDFAVDVCHLYGEAASVSSSALVVESYGNLEMIRNSK
jgi:hypothetical protein